MSMKLTSKKFVKPGLLLFFVFILILAVEAYSFYVHVYGSLSTDAADAPSGNVVRLDLASYNKTLQLLDSAKSFIVKPYTLGNPFR